MKMLRAPFVLAVLALAVGGAFAQGKHTEEQPAPAAKEAPAHEGVPPA